MGASNRRVGPKAGGNATAAPLSSIGSGGQCVKYHTRPSGVVTKTTEPANSIHKGSMPMQHGIPEDPDRVNQLPQWLAALMQVSKLTGANRYGRGWVTRMMLVSATLGTRWGVAVSRARSSSSAPD